MTNKSTKKSGNGWGKSYGYGLKGSTSMMSLATLAIKPSASEMTLFKPSASDMTLYKPESSKSSSSKKSYEPISFSSKDENDLYRKQYLEQTKKEKTFLGLVKKLISEIKTKGVQVEKPYKKAVKSKK
jgi:hypothetical protein